MATFGFGELIDNRFLFMDSIGDKNEVKVVKVEDILNTKVASLQYCSDENHKVRLDFINSCKNSHNIKGKNIAEVVHMNLDYEPPYIVMPLYKNNLLEEIPKLRGNVEEIIRIFKEICKGVKTIHNCGLTHNNLNPANILITNENGVMISNIGVISSDKNDNTLLSNNFNKVGNIIYSAPEELEGNSMQKIDERTDVYQLGKILYHMYTGEIPVLLCKESIPGELWGIIDKATKHNMDERYQTVGQLIDAISDCEGILHGEANFKLIYDNLFNECMELLSIGRYNDDKILNLIQVVAQNEESYDIFFDFLEKAPSKLIAIICQRYPERFEGIIESYYEFIKLYAQGFSLEYVDRANKTFEVIFRYSTNIDVKVKALKCLVYLATELNRYTSIESITRILNDISDLNDAEELVAGIRDENKKFAKIAAELPVKSFITPIKEFFFEIGRN